MNITIIKKLFGLKRKCTTKQINVNDLFIKKEWKLDFTVEIIS
jgi:hypothetical protein